MGNLFNARLLRLFLFTFVISAGCVKCFPQVAKKTANSNAAGTRAESNPCLCDFGAGLINVRSGDDGDNNDCNCEDNNNNKPGNNKPGGQKPGNGNVNVGKVTLKPSSSTEKIPKPHQQPDSDSLDDNTNMSDEHSSSEHVHGADCNHHHGHHRPHHGFRPHNHPHHGHHHRGPPEGHHHHHHHNHHGPPPNPHFLRY